MKIGPKLDWLNDDNRAGLSDGKDECNPAIRNRAADGYPERVRVAALEYHWQKRWGHGEAGMESEEGTRFQTTKHQLRSKGSIKSAVVRRDHA